MPNVEVCVVDVSFGRASDEKERAYLNEQPTNFFLPAEAVDRLRAAARKVVLDSPEFRQFLKDIGETIVK